jgi:hypothetical protein
MVGADGHFVGYEPLVCADDRKLSPKLSITSNGTPSSMERRPPSCSDWPKPQQTGGVIRSGRIFLPRGTSI